MKTENRIDHYIDLHAHLDGCITTEIARKLAALQQITLPAATDEELLSLLSVPDTCENLNDFLKCFDLPLSLLQTEEALEEAVYLILSEMKEDGVIYAELRFAPQLHTQKEMTQETAIHAALRGLKRAPIPGNLILCCMRGDLNQKENLETLELAKKYLVEDGGVVAIDLANRKLRGAFCKSKRISGSIYHPCRRGRKCRGCKNSCPYGGSQDRSWCEDRGK